MTQNPKKPEPGAKARPAPQAAAASQAEKQRGKVVGYPVDKLRTARPARARGRHRAAMLTFLLSVVAPTTGVVGYLYGYAADQYASYMAFSIRGNENAGPVSFLGALSQTVTIGGTDAEIVYDFVRSQQMVAAAFAALPLETYFNLPEDDVVFRLGEERPIEDKVAYWNRMTSVSFDGASGIVNFEARAFAPEDARAITTFVLQESTRIVNDISAQAREDAVSVARSVLSQAEDRLRSARLAIRTFRNTEQEIDPSRTAESTLSLVASLRQELAQTEVELDGYLALVGPRGPRAPALRQKIASLKERIALERERLGAGTPEVGDAEKVFSDLVGDYEELAVELQFAESAYISALSSFEQAQVEARRQTRFLSPHIQPTLSMEAQYPQRMLIALGAFVVLSVAWATLLLILYNVRDRR